MSEGVGPCSWKSLMMSYISSPSLLALLLIKRDGQDEYSTTMISLIKLLKGIGTLLSGFFGTITGPAVSVENVGLLGLTRVRNRRVIQISTGFMFFFFILGNFGAYLASIPLAIVAAIYCVLFAYVASAGLGFQKFCNLNRHRTMFIVAFSVFMRKVVPQYCSELWETEDGDFHISRHIVFINMVQLICLSPTIVVVIIAYFLDLTLPHHNNSI